MHTAQISILVELRRSFLFLYFCRGYTLTLMVLVFQVGWSTVTQATLLAVLVATALYIEVRPASKNLLRLGPKGALLQAVGEDEWVAAESVRVGLLHPWLTIFSAKFTNGETNYWAVFPDSCSSESFRKLRVWLKWEAKPGA